ncbi:ABC transporter substrate-binding protein [Aetokthonos hydrillicola Thurmond2011]|jgi:osmoprotectant transport system substrate-binding protein|uniref:ABC transporter substrate-binding protein n=1 Tax=Aetokthonos hydrillicola Thurmond2011 TaxID=2712845 RepID=A0AAP5M7T4_9CYAN|nr:glycine betaine ABC transporter substrate-binding protein [Aetokthonos hydrillicola]MBO3461495.1 ABC transporter substrate-binding protein [Aetokthonos hydrillicola CCALA 1050]MBW4584866.1 ABC transporter substrate-binding protein [Aetokthonos hydrillicola CCALA 1050]MDR9895415.1 ABC transporter substrate-binding protein [Aetokthonos hydrillicola Thurmond2011]
MKRLFAFLLLTFSLLLLIASCNVNSNNSGNGDIVVGSKGFTEQDILSELLAQQIEETTHLKVARRRFTSTLVTHQALTSGKIDAYVEYTGTAFTVILKQKAINDPKLLYEKLKQAYTQQFNLEVMEPLGFEDTFAMVIRGEDAKRYNIQTLSDFAKYAPKLRAGFGYEFIEREDGFPGLAKTYGLHFAQSPRIMDLGLIYRALQQKLVDMINGNSTDGQISRLGLVVLKDDLYYFPPYEAATIIRQETLKKYPQLRQVLAQLVGRISADDMRRLNSLVEGEFREIKDVVRDFRKAKGL